MINMILLDFIHTMLQIAGRYITIFICNTKTILNNIFPNVSPGQQKKWQHGQEHQDI